MLDSVIFHGLFQLHVSGISRLLLYTTVGGIKSIPTYSLAEYTKLGKNKKTSFAKYIHIITVQCLNLSFQAQTSEQFIRSFKSYLIFKSHVND